MMSAIITRYPATGSLSRNIWAAEYVLENLSRQVQRLTGFETLMARNLIASRTF
uniref:Uncharacterized protein n=1 Tax=Hyaloperonospora arabidopsidis (strain Emoy2) TaxID=559515 RepID=M4B163_HYAAE